MVMSDVLEHTAVTDGVIVVAVIADIMRNTLQRKKLHLYKFPMAEDRYTSIKSNSQYSWRQGAQKHLVHNRCMDISQITDVLTDKWMPNRLQQDNEVLCQPSCNNSLCVIDTNTS